jgi:AraC-like DNA-binding protein
VPAKYLDVRPSFADPSLHEVAVERLDLDARKSGSADGVKATVERLLAGSAHGRLDADLVARSMGLSTRTLTRKLSESGTDMRELTDAELRRRAQRYLKSNSFTMAEISERLGYADPTGFSRAQRRWKSSAKDGNA